MARPAKQTVDYFPHRCKGGKTLYILETRYSDKGYAFWFKVLETLGETESHAFRFDDPTNQEYFLAKTRTTTEQSLEILNLLAKLDAIDKNLWENGHIVWSDNFIDGIKDAYRNRTIDMPVKPVSDVRNPPAMLVSDVINPQIREEKIKEEKNKEKGKPLLLPEWLDKKLWEDFQDSRKKLKAPMTDAAAKYIIKDLEKFRAAGEDPNAVLEQAIKRGWKGVFSLKDNEKGGANGHTNKGARGTPGQEPSGAFSFLKQTDQDGE
jgi:hypothetical protein